MGLSRMYILWKRENSMREFDYMRLIDITKEYYDGKIDCKYMLAYWKKIRREKEKIVGEYSVGRYIIPNCPHIYWEVNE